MYIGKASEVTEELQQASQRLIPQLTLHKNPPTWDEITDLVKSESLTLLVARNPEANGAIIGILSLILYRVPTGVRSIVEDLVVDEEMRGHGVGKALLSYAIRLAREAGADGIALTSNPRRVAANQMYQSMGFEIRKTNAYIYELK